MFEFSIILSNLATENVPGMDNVWAQTGTSIVITFIAHLVIRSFVLRPLDRFA